MDRLLIEDLKIWKDKSDRKPLILRGARQVGKTWLLKDFGEKCFKDICYVNFEQKDMLGKIFEGTLSPQRIIEQLSVFHGKKIQPQETLLIFDEVQELPRALTSLKYFAEEAPEYAICCAGSLLGVALHEGTSFPVGKVDFLDLYPLSFREFLMANDEQMLVDYIMSGNRDLKVFEEKLIDYLKKYFIIGGMPAAILKWLDTHDFFEVDDVQKQILSAYTNDFSKHAPRQLVEKIRYVWDSIPSQLAKENKKFIFGLVREGARAREYEDSLLWLSDAGEIIRTYNVSKPDVPLKAYAELKNFKVFLMDVDNVYIADIYMIERKKLIYIDWVSSTYKYECRFLKKALVTTTSDNMFIDLSTRKKYRYHLQENEKYDVGEMIVNKVVPYVREVPVEKQHMSRKRVLKKYDEYMGRTNTKSREE